MSAFLGGLARGLLTGIYLSLGVIAAAIAIVADGWPQLRAALAVVFFTACVTELIYGRGSR